MSTEVKQRLGDLLLAANLIDEVQLHVALREQRETGERLGSALVHLGFIDETVLAAFLSRQSAIPCVNVNGLHVPPDVLALVEGTMALDRCVLPVRRTGDTLYLAMTDPFDEPALETVRRATGLEVVPMIAPEFCMKRALERLYHPERITAVEEIRGLSNIAEEIDTDELAALGERIDALSGRIEELTIVVRELADIVSRRG